MNEALIQQQNTPDKDLLDKNWSLFRSAPDHYDSPADFDLNTENTTEATVPGTVAMSVNGTAPQCWAPNIDYDDYDWWYHCQFNSPKIKSDQKIRLYFEGLATLCEVWLNGEKILKCNNMFRAYSIEINHLLTTSNTLTLVFRSITQNLKEKRPRPKWKTKLVENQQMRWIRSTVLGHVSVWTPPIKAVGPWKNIYIETSSSFDIEDVFINTQLINNIPQLELSATLENLSPEIKLNKAEIKINQVSYPVTISKNKNTYTLSCKLALKSLQAWMPHTHGKPNLYTSEIIITTDQQQIIIDSRKIGFKSSEFRFTENESALLINNQLIFCRGTCWTVSDYLSLNADYHDLKKHLTLLRNAGLNMLRVGGTMVYESDDFYQICDELGIMVWQDFMFASMDYPVEDNDFLNNVQAEVTHQLNRLNKHICITTYCGNTDIEAQAAMYGVAEENWSNSFFQDYIAESCKNQHPGIPYLASSPTGGTLPFHLSEGVTHYWGIGAYMHPIGDMDKYRVRFASEGMGLPHIPEDKTIEECTGKNTLYPYHNEWTSRVPRDLGAGWDFDAIRDFYLEEIFKLDAVKLRRQNVEKYIELSRVVTGEVISQVFQQWRSTNSQCNGGLIWFNRDFWPSAGFGLIDSSNAPKAAYYQLKQNWASQSVILTNEGLDGAAVSIINEMNAELNGSIKVILLKDNHIMVAQASEKIKLAANSKQKHSVDKILGRFYDTGYAYKFGQPQFDIVICQLKNEDKEIVHETFLFLEDQNIKPVENIEISAIATIIDKQSISLKIISDNFLQYMKISVKNYQPDDNYFHLTPDVEKNIILKQIEPDDKKFRGQLDAINLNHSIKIKLHD